MKLIRLLPILLVIGLSCLTSCRKEEIPSADNERTLFMYLPWSTNLTSYFYQNIDDMEDAISRRGLDKERVLVFLSTSSTEAELFEITVNNGTCTRQILKEYTRPAFTTEEGLTGILNDMKSFAPAKTYSLIVGCHGMGWLPVAQSKARATMKPRYHWEYSHTPSIQRMDGYSPVIFYDFGDYVRALCGDDAEQLAQFETLLEQVVPYKAHTEKYFTAARGPLPIERYSGITTSAPSTNSLASSYSQTSWYLATH